MALLSLTSGEKTGAVALVGVGLSTDEDLRTSYGIEEFAIDDHIFDLSRDPDVFAAIPDFVGVTHEIATTKLSELAAVLRRNDLPIRRTKRYLHLLRAIVGFRASSAAFVDRLLTKSVNVLGASRVREFMAPLVDDVEEAVRAVSA